MKKVSVLLTIAVMLLNGLSLKAQTPEDYFTGDWKVVVIGTPNGDAEMIMHLERIEGKLKGELRGEEGGDPIKIDRIEEKENAISVYYFAAGYDVSMDFEKVDENNLKGSLLGMFTANGTRIVE
jgi:hypothetical protein